MAGAIGIWLARARVSDHPGASVPVVSVTSAARTTSVQAASPSPVKAAPAGAPAVTDKTATQLRILGEIFVSKNDNDPRLDSDLRKLDEEAKAAFRAKYRALPPELRNERGTIVFLLGRNLTTAGDYAFMKNVLSEPPA